MHVQLSFTVFVCYLKLMFTNMHLPQSTVYYSGTM